jgi:hypothetical protein
VLTKIDLGANKEVRDGCNSENMRFEGLVDGIRRVYNWSKPQDGTRKTSFLEQT